MAAPAVGQARSSAPDFNWSGSLASGQDVEVQNLNGSITVNRASGDSVTVHATRTADRSDPNSTRIVVSRDGEGVVICALFNDQDSSDCARSHVSHTRSGERNRDNNDTRVTFTVELPAGVSAKLFSVNGSVEAHGLASPVDASVVNGHVSISTSSYARAHTVNGSINVSMGNPNWPDDSLAFAAVNGAIDVTIPSSTSARIHMKTMHGSISSDFGISRHDGAFGVMQYADGVIGSGKRTLDFTTINGSIRLAKGP